MTSVNQLDSSAEAALRELHAACSDRAIPFMLAGVKGPARVVMARSGLWKDLGDDAKRLRVHAMVSLVRSAAAAPTP